MPMRSPNPLKAVIISVAVLLLLPSLAVAQDDDDGRYTSSDRSRLRELRDSHRDSSDDFDDLRRDFRDTRNRIPVENVRRPSEAESMKPPAPGAGGRPVPQAKTGRPSKSRPEAGRPQPATYGVVPGRPPEQGGKPPEISTTHPILFFDQPDLYVTPDEPFEIELRLSNPTSEAFDEMAVTLDYDPAELELLDADPDTEPMEVNAARSDLVERYSWLSADSDLYSDDMDPDLGRISIRLRTPEGKTDILEGTIGRFWFVPRASMGQIPLTFVFADGEGGEPATFLRLGDEDILGAPNRMDDGVLDAGFRVSPRIDVSEEDDLPGGDYRTRIYFEPPQAELTMGDVLHLDIVVDNPNEVPFDTINLVLGYNPKVLKVIDSDQNNWIKEGVNINDSHSIAEFHFTARERNRVLPRTGVILYRSSSEESPLRSEGVLATVRLLAIGTTGEDGSPLQVGFHSVKEPLNSGLFYRGRDVLGDSEDPTDGFGGFRVFVDQRQVTRRDTVWDRLRELE
jgi:hypothetical protein